MLNNLANKLIVLEMANNHMGDVAHGLETICQFAKVCQDFPQFNFAFKLQYRDLDTFIHPAMQKRDDVKYIKRFNETRLSRNDFDLLIEEIRSNGFLAMSTPFDEASVGVIEDQRLDIIKIASCSFTDWPLLERIVKTKQPIIASTAGASLDDIDRVVSFLAHRQKDFAILHCVGEYPTADSNMNLSQIDFLKTRYPGVVIGFSTHEPPDNTDIVKMAIAKGASIFEKHVGFPTEKYSLNAYSSSPQQLRRWLEAAQYATQVCGVGDTRPPVNNSEVDSLRSLRRGVFARRDIAVGETLTDDDIYFAFPPEPDQYTANDWSKYSSLTTTREIKKNAPVTTQNGIQENVRAKALKAVQDVKKLLKKSHITVPGGADLELSHHYGIERFYEVGLTMITVVNRAYCKKLLVSLPGQRHPEQFHKQKEETFHVLYGNVDITLDDVTNAYGPGDIINVEPGVRHAFVSASGAVIEEISSTHIKNDSFYTDDAINNNKNRKTILTYWMS